MMEELKAWTPIPPSPPIVSSITLHHVLIEISSNNKYKRRTLYEIVKLVGVFKNQIEWHFSLLRLLWTWRFSN